MELELERTCTKCHVTKAMEEFYLSPTMSNPIQRMTTCRVCHIARSNRRLDQDKDKRHEEDVFRRYRKLGLSRDAFWELWYAQDGKCGILGCGVSLEEERGHVDHDHESGAIRGILCHRCNKALGLFLDRPDVMRGAALYVEKPRQVPPDLDKSDICKTPGCENLRVPRRSKCGKCHAAYERAKRPERAAYLVKRRCNWEGCEGLRHRMASQTSTYCEAHHRLKAKERREAKGQTMKVISSSAS